MITRHVVFTGRVQGVGFRQSCLQRATRLRLTGWIRNLPNSTVEAIIQGAPDQVARWLTECTTNLPFASVDSATMRDVSDTNLYPSFEIRR